MKVINRRNLIAACLLLCAALCFAREEKERKFFGFQFAVGGTVPLYGDGAQWNNHAKMTDDHYARIVIGSDVGFTLKLAEQLFFVCDFETCSDFGWNSSYHSNSLDYAFAGGFQYYPGWFKWTLLTIPMGFIGYWLKKDKWWGLFIIVPVMIFEGYHYSGFLRECWRSEVSGSWM